MQIAAKITKIYYKKLICFWNPIKKWYFFSFSSNCNFYLWWNLFQSKIYEIESAIFAEKFPVATINFLLLLKTINYWWIWFGIGLNKRKLLFYGKEKKMNIADEKSLLFYITYYFLTGRWLWMKYCWNCFLECVFKFVTVLNNFILNVFKIFIKCILFLIYQLK